MRRTIQGAALTLLIAGVTALIGAATMTTAGAADAPAPTDVAPIIVGPYQPYDGITAVAAVSPPGTTLTVRFVVFDLPPGVQALTPESLSSPQTVRAIVDATLGDDPDHPTRLDPGTLHGCDVEEQADLVPATPTWLALKVGDTVTVPIPGAFAASAEHLNDSCAATPPPTVVAPPPTTTPPPAVPPTTAPPVTTTTPATPVSEPTLSCLTDRCEFTVASVPPGAAIETGVEAAVATRAPLPNTGGSPGPLVLLGSGLVLCGVLFLISAARRNMAAGR